MQNQQPLLPKLRKSGYPKSHKTYPWGTESSLSLAPGYAQLFPGGITKGMWWLNSNQIFSDFILLFPCHSSDDVYNPKSITSHLYFRFIWDLWIYEEGGFAGGTVVKHRSVSAGDPRGGDSIPGLGRSPGGGNGNHSSIVTWKIP